MILQIIFWSCIVLVLYTYALYPLVAVVAARMVRRNATAGDDGQLPGVSIVISVFNEESVLEEKIRNLQSLDYPQDRIEYLFGSDGSTDSTSPLLERATTSSLRPFLFPDRRGKAPVLNDLVAHARGDIIVFSDANTMYHPETIRRLAGHFADPSIGAVCGELRLTSDPRTSGGFGEVLYWKYESLLKMSESRMSTLLGATGGVYALRKSLYVPLPVDKSVTDDLLIPLRVVERGFRVVYEPDALAFEPASNSVIGEYRRKVRIAASNFNTVAEFWHLLLPQRGLVAFSLWSHKILRWIVPLLLLIMTGISIALRGRGAFYTFFLDAAIVFLIVASLAFVLERLHIRIGVWGLPYYFVATNAALLVGLLKSIAGSQRPTWDVVR